MPLASTNYPVLSIFWSILEFFLWVIWIWILIMIFIDIFRSHDLSGWAKALWFLFVLLIPLVGVLVYLIVRGGSMHERSVRQAQHEADAFYSSYGRHAAAGRRTAVPTPRISWPSWPTCATAACSARRSSNARRPRSSRPDGGREAGAGAGHQARPSRCPAAPRARVEGV